MQLDTYRWTTVLTRAWASAGETHKQGWLAPGTKLHCVEVSGTWYRFDKPVLETLTASYPNSWVDGQYTTAQPPDGETPQVPVPIGDIGAAVATLIRFVKAVWRE